MTFISYSQNFEDVLLWRAFSKLRSGFYIDVGASHPDIDSVTRAFYDRGWTGINVEPTSSAYLRLTASRPRDINLNVALGAAPGRMPFHSVEGADSGLSTLDPGAASRVAGMGLRSTVTSVEVETLASVCRRHAVTDIHFLKIDVEGSEADVLKGADFTSYRPWILVVEATSPMSSAVTYAQWEDLVLEAQYQFVWFDGLNRFYVADEHCHSLVQHFKTPPNVFDDFLRAADTEWARRLAYAEGSAATLLTRALTAENRVAVTYELAEAAHLRSLQHGVRLSQAETIAHRSQQENQRLEAIVQRAEADLQLAERKTAQAEEDRALAQSWVNAMRGSTTWRLMGPLRRLLRVARGRTTATRSANQQDVLEPDRSSSRMIAAVPTKPIVAAPPFGAVHQFHSGTAVGDAITNAMFLVRDILRKQGFESHIFAQHRAPSLTDQIFPIEALPTDNQYVLIVRHSMGHDCLSQILSLPVPKILIYHNITPSDLLGDTPHLQEYAVKGRKQLGLLRPAIVTALADSEFNAFELRRAGFPSVATCSLLFDVERLLASASASAPRRSDIFTILFVGRLARSKGQLELVAAYARFRAVYQGQSRLVLVGRNSEDAYASEVFALVRLHKLDTGGVEITGTVSDVELHDRFAVADLYVSLSRHEGFGVPLIEAMAHRVPILALPAGAVAETLGASSELLTDLLPSQVAEQMVRLAEDPVARAEIVRRQLQSLGRFSLDRQVPVLTTALERAGAKATPNQARDRALGSMLCYTVAGHVNGSYSLAEVNRSLASALDRERPGAVRLLAVEGELTTNLSGIPPEQRAETGRLIARAPPLTGPHVVISQHYPVWAPPQTYDLALAFFFWEESLVPRETVEVLNESFDGVLAPSRSVAKALIDSGVAVPVRVLGHAPNLERFYALAQVRAERPKTGLFTFLHVSSGFPRKGVDILISAFAGAFRRGDPVILLIKCFRNPHNTVSQQLAELRQRNPNAPEITLIEDDLSIDALLDLYQRADAMVLPTRGEGFNLPAAEALASGLQLIVTGHGGHLDYITRAPAEQVRLIDYTLTTAETHLSTPFSLWAEPDVSDLTVALLEATAQPTTVDPGFEFRLSTIASRLQEIALECVASATPQSKIAIITTWGVPCGIAGYTRHLVDVLGNVETIFADRRSDVQGGADLSPRVMPAWTIGGDEDFEALATNIVTTSPNIIIIQHQPGLMRWQDLADLIALPALVGRVVCVTLHNTRHLFDTASADRDLATLALQRASRVVVHTLADVNRLAHIGLISNVTLIPQGVIDDGAFVSLSQNQQRTVNADDEIVIGCYGFFLPDKGIADLIQAIPNISASYPRVKLVLINAAYPDQVSEDEIDRCIALSKSLHVSDKVTFMTDFLTDQHSAELLARCDLIVLPYQRSSEASSAALRSAMVVQIPIAVTPLQLFDEAEDSVYRLPGYASQDIADGIVALLSDPKLRESLVGRASAWRSQRSWAYVGQRWNSLLRGLLGSKMTVKEVDAVGHVF